MFYLWAPTQGELFSVSVVLEDEMTTSLEDTIQKSMEALDERHMQYGEPRDWSAYRKDRTQTILTLATNLAREARIDELKLFKKTNPIHWAGIDDYTAENVNKRLAQLKKEEK